MNWFLALLIVASHVLVTCTSEAADRARPVQIGVLTPAWGPPPQVVGLRDGLRELGYREHEQFVIGVRFTQGDLAALPAAARQLVQYGVDLLFVSQPTAAKAAQQATSRIPIIFAGVGDPVEQGLVESFARPRSPRPPASSSACRRFVVMATTSSSICRRLGNRNGLSAFS